MGIIILKILAILVPLLISIAYLTLAERKVLGYIQCRKGPNVVGVYGLLQPLADGLKLFTKEIIIPNHANIFIYNGSNFIINFGFYGLRCNTLWSGNCI